MTLLTGCQASLDDLDSIFYNGDGRTVHCAVDLDTKSRISIASIDAALDRAAERGETLELYAHNPEKSVRMEVIEHLLAGARDRGLAFVTYADFAQSGGVGPGLALSFDDTSVFAWHDTLPLFADYNARITFFISRYQILDADGRAAVKDLAAAGHDIEPHSVNHVYAPDYVEQHGIAAYLHDEIDPELATFAAEGYDVHAFAYPFGARTRETDRALKDRVAVLRSVEFSYPEVASPCPL